MKRPNGQHKYSALEDAWLKENIDLYTWDELTTLFNRKFGTNIKSVSDHALKALGLRKTINRGNCPKGTRRNTNTLPIGAERFNGQDVYIKIADNVNECKNGRMPGKHDDPNWKRKDYIVWENAGNRLPKDSSEMLIHLNGNRQDCRIENLYLTTRKINFELVKNNWHSDNPELTLIAIKYCELQGAIKEARKGAAHK